MTLKVVLFSLFVSVRASAALFADLSGLYITDSFTTATSATNSKMYYSLDIFANLDTKKRWMAGFHVDQISFTESPTSATTYTLTSLNMGLMGLVLLNRTGSMSLSGGYNLVANGTYSVTGESGRTLTGTSIWAAYAVMPEVSENLFVGVKLLYYQVSYSKSTVTTTATDVSYSRTFIAPILGLQYRY